MDKYKNNSSISDQVREDNKLKGVEVTLKILSENKQEIKIDKIQAIEDLKLIFDGTDSNNIYQDKMINEIYISIIKPEYPICCS